ncbi:hypothetical protein MDA_GLEAN10005702 [Myotis davidii]|uniref:Uncharacterized protein n=1 Tax=Myotis davidii TaxID=225400 RepID=L5LU02_MYODS|nr:hypothetical protein MDA_GLEAN10005702 [Myotis davidii]
MRLPAPPLLPPSPPTAHHSPPRELDASPVVEVEFQSGQSPPHPLGLGSGRRPERGGISMDSRWLLRK